VRPGQRKTCLAMLGDRECGAVPIQNGNEILAFVQIRGSCKLSVMGILWQSVQAANFTL